MFLRSHARNKDGKEHAYWSLVETVRTPAGPRQRKLCYLGELNGSAQQRWLKTIEVFNGQGETTQLKLFPAEAEAPADDPAVARVLVEKVRLERTRQFGACFWGWELWKQLRLDRFYEEAVDSQEADVPWSRVAAVLAINRLCAPGSELAIEQRWYPSTALDDLLGIEDGKEHAYWSLVETVRTPAGPRQRKLCYLGELNGSAQQRWLKTIEVFNEQGETTQLKLFPAEAEAPVDDPAVARVLVEKVRLERTRQFGACFLGWELWKQLRLDRFYEEAVDSQEADVPWSRVAAVLAINRLCAPGSELAIEQRWYPSTALDDLLDIEDGKINDTRLYRCLDQLLPHKTKLEQHLKQRYGELFGAEFDVLLYDLTSTYVEGAAEKNPMMRRGYSRDHRPDCEQMVIALIVNQDGFPFSYETFDGNRADVSTMEAILRMVERKYGKARRIWVMDRGIVSEENLAAIRKRNGQYLVGTPRSQMKRFEAELLKDDWTQVRPEVEVKSVSIPGGEETYILCRTAGRKEKEQAIRSRFSTRNSSGGEGRGVGI